MELSDGEMVRECLKGNKDVFGKLMKKYENMIYSFVLSVIRHSEEARDITQMTFIKAYLALEKLKEPSKFKFWARSIAYRLCIDRVRSSRNVISFSEGFGIESCRKMFNADVSDSPGEIVQRKERRRIILEALDSLSEEVRSVIFLRYMQEMSYKEISEYLRIPLSTVKWRLHNGIHLLRNRLDKSIMKG